MLTRVTTAQIAPDAIDETAAYWRDVLIPAAKNLNGWHSAELFVNQATGACLIVAQWASQADLTASAAALQAQFAHFGTFLTSAPTAEVYDLVIDA